MIKIFVAILTLPFASVWAGGVSSGEALTLRQALALALERNPELQAFDDDVRIAEAEALQAGLWPNPVLGAEIENIGGAGALRGTGAAETTLSLEQLIVIGGKRAARIRAARLERAVASFDYEAKKREIFTRTAQAFVSVLAAERRVTVDEELLKITETGIDAAQRRVEAGRTSAVEVTRQQLALATVKIDLAQARRELAAARQVLASQWGSSDQQFSHAQGELEETTEIGDYQQLWEQLARHPRVARFDALRAQLAAALQAERRNAIPDLTMRGGVRHFRESDDAAFVVGGAVPLPLFNRNQGNIRAAQVRLEKIAAQQAAVSMELTRDLSRAYRELTSSAAELQLLREEVLPAARQAFNEIEQGFAAGRFSSLDRLDAQQTLINARLQHIQALTDFHTAKAAVEGLTAHPPQPELSTP